MEKTRENLKEGGRESSPLSRKIILLIGNSAPLRGFLRLTLMGALPEVVVREAQDDAQVLSELTHQWIDLIFLDMDIPTLDARALLRMIHGDPRLARKPVVALAGRITPELLREFKGDRAVWFIEKPAQAEEVTEVVWRFLGQ
ncbi:MAG TPA: response regulator [bacterium]|nr:response regulator [bacterium]